MYQILAKSWDIDNYRGYLLVLDTDDNIVSKIKVDKFLELGVSYSYNDILIRNFPCSQDKLIDYSSYFLSEYENKENNVYEMHLHTVMRKFIYTLGYTSYPPSYEEYKDYVEILDKVISGCGAKLTHTDAFIIPYSPQFMSQVRKKEFIMLKYVNELVYSDIDRYINSSNWGNFKVTYNSYGISGGIEKPKFKSKKQRLVETDEMKRIRYEEKKKAERLKEQEAINELINRDISSLDDIITRVPRLTSNNFYTKDGDVISMDVTFDLLSILDESKRKEKVFAYKDLFISYARNLLLEKSKTFKKDIYKINFKYYLCTRFIYRKNLSQVTVEFKMRDDVLKLKNDLQSSAVQDYKDKHHIV